jgi:hypothetical protein
MVPAAITTVLQTVASTIGPAGIATIAPAMTRAIGPAIASAVVPATTSTIAGTMALGLCLSTGPTYWPTRGRRCTLRFGRHRFGEDVEL